MKKFTTLFTLILFALLMTHCAHKKVVTEAPAPVAAPEVEKVDEQTTKVDQPVLSEEEIFQQKSLDQLNQEGNLKRIHFDFDKYEIREDMKSILSANTDWLLKHKSIEVLIEGHCDERGTIEYNIALGEKRAESAQNYVASLGVPTGRIKIVSYGKNKPLTTGNDEESFAQNRRAEFVITKK